MRRFTWTLEFIILCSVLLFLARAACFAASDPSNPSLWKHQSLSPVITAATSYSIDVAGAANATPSPGKTAVLRSWCGLSMGAPVSFTLAITTGTHSTLAASTTGYNVPAPRGWSGSAPDISTATWNLPAGVSVCDEPTEYPINPIFAFSLQPSATLYFYITYGVPQ